jgi:serine/threonine protein phosphatase PrpC
LGWLAAAVVLALIASRAIAKDPNELLPDASTPQANTAVLPTGAEIPDRQLGATKERLAPIVAARARLEAKESSTIAPALSAGTGFWPGRGLLLAAAALTLVGVAVVVVVTRRCTRPIASPQISIEREAAQPTAQVCTAVRVRSLATESATVPVGPIACSLQKCSTGIIDVLEQLAREATVMVRPVVNHQRLGFCTHRGFVREHNEDCVMGFEIEGKYFIGASDGVCGEPDGARASHNAVRGASRRMMEMWGGAARRGLDPATVAAVSLSAGQREIMRAIGFHKGAAVPERGCRATLLVAIVDGDRLGFAYLGDGGGCVRRADTGQVESFVTPMKAAPGSSTIVGSLGPVLEGEPRTGCVRVGPGDLVLLGTDGIFDRVALDDLCRGVMDALREFHGDIPLALKAIVDDLAGQRTVSGHLICDDNMTLAAIIVPELAGPETAASGFGGGGKA